MVQVPTKVAGLGLTDMAITAATKIVSSRFLTPAIGGRSVFVAGAKAIGAIILGTAAKGQLARGVALGLGIDAAEDVIDLVLGGAALGTPGGKIVV